MPRFRSAGTSHGSPLNMEQSPPGPVPAASRGARIVRAGQCAGPHHKESIMAYGSDDGDDNRWRDRNRGERGGGWRGEGRGGYERGDDRGFFDRAGDEVRSWFGDDEAQRRREMDERRWE